MNRRKTLPGRGFRQKALLAIAAVFAMHGCSTRVETVKEEADSVPPTPRASGRSLHRESTPLAPAAKHIAPPPSEAIIDSDMDLAESLAGSERRSVQKGLALVSVRYYSFDGKLHKGQILVRKDLAKDVAAIFGEIESSRFPISKVIPISKYGWSDDDSVADDNGSGFNYRFVPGTHVLSRHSFGDAIDLNPSENPYLGRNAQGAVYDPSKPGTFTSNCAVVRAFRRRGWSWGGLWRRVKDYQHFEKRSPRKRQGVRAGKLPA